MEISMIKNIILKMSLVYGMLNISGNIVSIIGIELCKFIYEMSNDVLNENFESNKIGIIISGCVIKISINVIKRFFF